MNNIIIFCLVACIIVPLGSALDPTKISIALNCGSNTQYVNSFDGSFKYQPDAGFVTGQSVDVDYHTDTDASSSQFKYSHQKELFMFQRHTYQEMTYSLPVKAGYNTLILKFAQMYFRESGKRVFNVKIGDKVIIENLDIFEKTGARFAAHQQFIEFQVRKDGLYIDSVRVPKGYQGGKVKVSFVKGLADNPIVQGIMVYNRPIEHSPRDQYLKIKRQWASQHQMRKARKEQQKIKQLIKIQKKKEKMRIRNDQLVFEERDTSQQSDAAAPQKFGKIRLFLMSPIGIIVWAAGFLYLMGFFYYKIFKLGRKRQLAQSHND